MLIKRRLQMYDLLAPNHNFQFLISSETVTVFITILFIHMNNNNDDNNKYSINEYLIIYNTNM